jgi:hypothetical protein
VTSYWRWHADQQSQSYGAQLAAVYYFRRKFWDAEFGSVRSRDARRFVSIAIKRWTSDFDRGCIKKDIDVCRAIYESREYVPGLKLAEVERRRVALSRLSYKQSHLTKLICLACWLSFLKTKILLRINLKRYSNEPIN